VKTFIQILTGLSLMASATFPASAGSTCNQIGTFTFCNDDGGNRG
jgi:hypothetical protein